MNYAVHTLNAPVTLLVVFFEQQVALLLAFAYIRSPPTKTHMRQILLLAIAVCMASCATIKPVETAKYMNIYGPGVLHNPVIADLDVKNTKVTGTATGYATDRKALEVEAIAAAIKGAAADLLVEPSFAMESAGGARIQVTVTGFPANYQNFRPATQADLPLIEAGIAQRANVVQAMPEPPRKKNGAGGIVVGFLVLMGIVALVVSGGA